MPQAYNMTVQLGNGEQVTAPMEAWFLAIMRQFSDTQRHIICQEAAKIAAEAIEVPVAKSPIPKQHQIISPSSITRFSR